LKQMAENGSELEKVGYQVIDDFLTEEQCRLLLNKISEFREEHTLADIHRPMKGRSLRY